MAYLYETHLHTSVGSKCSTQTPEEQLRRIELRNGREMMERFRARWIPMEERYFEHYGICEKADLTL